VAYFALWRPPAHVPPAGTRVLLALA